MASDVHRRDELAAFLRRRRESADPERFGLPRGRRRTSGLRREELAVLAGVSPTWYSYIEQGRNIRPSDDVIDGIARVLGLTVAEHAHLRTLASRRSGRMAVEQPLNDVELQAALDRFEPWPAYLTGPLADVLMWNQSSTEWFTDFSLLPPGRSLLRWMLTAPEARRRLVHWENATRDLIARVRGATADCLDVPEIAATLAELQEVSPPTVRCWWTERPVEGPTSTLRRLRHPTTGETDMRVWVFTWGDDPSVRLVLHVPVERPAPT
jgi:transcriptional regulator with XRE-family HTH domain